MKNILPKKSLCILALISAITLFSLLDSGAENAVSLNKNGWDSYRKTEYDRALFSFTNSLRLNSRYTDSMIGAGKTYYALGVYDKALEMFSDALKIDGNSVDALNGMGMVLSETGRFTGAIGYFEKAYGISGNSIDSRYGVAYVYYRMGRKLWSRRKLESIFKSNPYHYPSLLLMADIKAEEGRLKEAREFVERAIDSEPDVPDGHIKYGNILLKAFIVSGEDDYLHEARESYSRALAVNPMNFSANLEMGLINLMEIEDIRFRNALSSKGDGDGLAEKNSAAIAYIQKALEVNRGRKGLYALSLAYESSGNKDRSLEQMLGAYKKFPSDSILKGKLENFLVLNDYKSAHPARIMLSNENIELARLNRLESLHTNVIFYLRRSLLMNPLNRTIREELISYYSTLGYNSLMIDEIKNILQQYPEFRYQEMLNLAVIKRRDRLYVREGYANSDIPRDVPRVLVLNFNTAGKITDHPDSGKIVAENLTFAIRQFGRMNTPGLGEREALAGRLKTDGDNLLSSIKKVKEVSDGEGRRFDYLIYGDLTETDDYLSVNYRIMDLNRGYIVYELSGSQKGRENLNLLSVIMADRIYDIIPYMGKVMKVKEKGILVNLGLVDGVKEGTELVIYSDSRSAADNETVRNAEIFTVRESDTYMSYAEPDRPDILRKVDSTNSVYPLMKKRARRIE